MSDVIEQKKAPTVAWSEDEDRIILVGLEAGQGPARINDDLPHRTRNAVIGRINRQREAGKFPKTETAPRTTPPKRQGDEITPSSRPPTSLPPSQEPRAAVATINPMAFVSGPDPQTIVRPVCDEPVIPIGQRCGILELTDKRCKWPLNEPTRFETYVFCGGEALPGFPYCKEHMRDAYKPLSAYGRHPPNRRPVDD